MQQKEYLNNVDFVKVDQALLERNIAKYAGKIAKGNLIYDIAYSGIAAGTDFFDYGKLGEETAKAITAIYGGTSTAIFASIATEFAIPPVLVATANIIAAVEKDFDYYRIQKEQEELSVLNNNSTQSLLDSLKVLNGLTMQLAQSKAASQCLLLFLTNITHHVN